MLVHSLSDLIKVRTKIDFPQGGLFRVGWIFQYPHIITVTEGKRVLRLSQGERL
jgi:hypothetical protein